MQPDERDRETARIMSEWLWDVAGDNMSDWLRVTIPYIAAALARRTEECAARAAKAMDGCYLADMENIEEARAMLSATVVFELTGKMRGGKE